MKKVNVTYECTTTTSKNVTVTIDRDDLGWFLTSIEKKGYKVLAVEPIKDEEK